MLAVAQRLRRSNEFAAAFRGGRRAGRGTLVVHLKSAEPRPDDTKWSRRGAPTWSTISTSARAGFVVSKAVGNAVVRNRVRRRLRHLVRERLGELPAGSILVVRALPAAADASYPGSARISTRPSPQPARRGRGRRSR